MKIHSLSHRIMILATVTALLLLLGVTISASDASIGVPNAGWGEVGAGSATGGGLSNDDVGSGGDSVAVAPDGTPYVAWNNDAGGEIYEIYVLRWNGSAWEEVGAGSATGGGISNNGSNSNRPSIAFVPDGTPYVAWQNDVGSGINEIYVRRWNGSIWEEVGAGSATGGGISNNGGDSRRASAAVLPDGVPYIAWQDNSSGNYEIYVRRWNGSSWEETGPGSATGGGISNNAGSSEWPRMTVAPDGKLYIVWHDNSSGDYEIYIRRWNGSGWEEVGAGSATGGGISDNYGNSSYASVAISANGIPYVGWGDDSSGNYEIYVRRWNGSKWEEAGAGSASGGGISNNNGRSVGPWLAASPDGGELTIVWMDNSFGNNEIYALHWNGSDWEEGGAGSSSGGGVSDNYGSSAGPSLTIAPDGTRYASWEDQSGGNKEIYVRQWEDETPPPPPPPPFPDDTHHPAGAVHAHDNMIWPPNNKMVEVTLDGYVIDELSIARDGEGIGVSLAYILVDDQRIILRNETIDLLDENGAFSVTTEVQAVKGAVYQVELYAADTEPEEDGGPNEGLVDATYIHVPKNK